MTFVPSISAMIVAGVLLYTGLVHAWQPYFFIYSITAYRILPSQLAGTLGIILPYLQIVLALCIATRQAERASLWMASGLFAVFTLAQAIVLIRGLEIDCGCFGYAASPVNGFTILMPITLLVTCVLAMQSRQVTDGSFSANTVVR